ncbi:winged helix-turn-helix transcriptional regulator [Aquimarina mytili]|uniref:Helix-turn-helix transcriptional regulator n=1 Tax=Aquimarina mytili TaxID=874423 RepID=A0A937A0L6_9FLAO|nr:helix-turn-helix domain-containing protein [Aquimarina mytili]MBL0685806.1 helix-turn-helix transcriptional regulator [Aquimarina mytili]
MIIEGEHKGYKINEKIYHCGTSVTMGFIGGKWKCVVLWNLRKGALRFSELGHLSPYITEKMLSIQLKSLEEDGLIERTSYGKKAPYRVYYNLTSFGKTLIPVIEVITNWGIELATNKGELVDL